MVLEKKKRFHNGTVGKEGMGCPIRPPVPETTHKKINLAKTTRDQMGDRLKSCGVQLTWFLKITGRLNSSVKIVSVLVNTVHHVLNKSTTQLNNETLKKKEVKTVIAQLFVAHFSSLNLPSEAPLPCFQCFFSLCFFSPALSQQTKKVP